MQQVRSAAAATFLFVLTAGYLGMVFQVTSPAFWSAGLGDWIDPYFINSLLEWWYQAARRLQNPASPPVFHPEPGTLGYSHGLILFAPFYLPVRLFLHPFQAYNLSILLVIATGTVSLYYCLRRLMGLTFVEALVLTAFFAASPNVLNPPLNVWTQRASVYLVPPIMLVALAAVAANGNRRLILAFVAGCLTTLLYTQDFYSAHFTFLFAGIALLPWTLRWAGRGFVAGRWFRGWPMSEWITMGIAAAALLWTCVVTVTGGTTLTVVGVRIRSTDPLRPALIAVTAVLVLSWLHRVRLARRLDECRQSVGAWAAAGAGAALGLGIFLSIYLPVYRTFPGFGELEYLQPLHPRSSEILLSPVAFIRGHDGYGTLRTFVLFGVAAVVCWLPIRRARPLRLDAVVWLAVAVLVLLVPFRFGAMTVWGLLLRPLPGFEAIRDPTRIAYQFELAAVLAVALVLSSLPRRSLFRMSLTALAGVLLVVSPNRTVFEFNRPNADFDRWVAAPIRVDPSCRSFYMQAASAEYLARSPEPWTLYSNDAAFIALRLGIPTLHGVSAWTPPGWQIRQPHDPDFTTGILEWTARHALTGVCAMDLGRRTMMPGLPVAGRGAADWSARVF